jgi:hypothetical protein
MYNLALRYHTPAALSFLRLEHSFLRLEHSFLRAQISNYIANCTAPRLTTPTLLYEELRIQLQDVVFWYMAKRPGSKYRFIGPYFDNAGDADRDFRGVWLFVKGMRERNPEVGRGLDVWEGALEWYVSVLAQKWWERFG